jgi:hypothetical protein
VEIAKAASVFPVQDWKSEYCFESDRIERNGLTRDLTLLKELEGKLLDFAEPMNHFIDNPIDTNDFLAYMLSQPSNQNRRSACVS